MKKLLEGGKTKEEKENDGLNRKKRKRFEIEDANRGSASAANEEVHEISEDVIMESTPEMNSKQRESAEKSASGTSGGAITMYF